MSPVTLPVRLAIDLAALFLLVRGAFLPRGGDPGRLLMLMSFNIVLFLMAHLLGEVQMTMGAAFGLFAVFSLLRFRTEGISLRDMTYLFLAIALALLAAVGPPRGWALAGLAAVIPVVAILLESGWLFPVETAHAVDYDRLPLLAPEARAALLEDLRARTGLRVHRVEIRRIDLVREVAHLVAYGPRA